MLYRNTVLPSIFTASALFYVTKSLFSWVPTFLLTGHLLLYGVLSAGNVDAMELLMNYNNVFFDSTCHSSMVYTTITAIITCKALQSSEFSD